MICPKCNEHMENLGNINNVVYTSYPSQWDEVWVCHDCKVKKTVRVHERIPDKVDVSGYSEIDLPF
jgi:hypothetical protein